MNQKTPRQAALRVLEARPEHVSMPRLSTSRDDETCFCWAKGENVLHAIIDEDLHLVWAIARGKNITPGQDIDLASDSPAQLWADIASL